MRRGERKRERERVSERWGERERQRERESESSTSNTHVEQAAPHDLELIYQLLVQGTHFWVHQLLMNSQAHSQDMNLHTCTERMVYVCEETKSGHNPPCEVLKPTQVLILLGVNG